MPKHIIVHTARIYDSLPHCFKIQSLDCNLNERPLVWKKDNCVVYIALLNNNMSWPWMKSATAATTPISIPNDQRPAVADLIREHQTSINQLKEQLAADVGSSSSSLYYDSTKHDDLWLLRFVLSHNGKIAPALKAAQNTLRFRHEHNLDDADVRFNEMPSSKPRMQAVLKIADMECYAFAVPDPERGVIVVMSPGRATNLHRVLTEVKDEELESFFISISEWTHQWLDYVTRTTGRLTRAIRILDMQNMGLSNFHRGAVQKNAKHVNAMEDCYPQLLQTVFACHAPSVVQGVWRFMRPLLPQRLSSKFDFINPEKRPKDLAKLLQYMDVSFLPTRFGGENEEWPVRSKLPAVN